MTHRPGRPSTMPRRPGGTMLALLWHQVRYEQLSFWRNPQSAIFTFVFPVVFVTIIGALFGGGGRSSYFDGLSALQYYVPTIAALSVLGSCYGQLAVALAARRQNGILKRVRATPLPGLGYFPGLLAHCVLVSVVDIALIVGVGRLYGVPLPTHWPAIAVTLVLGAASFCALGVAVASVIRNAEAAPAVAQLVLFPLLFLSGTYLPIHSAAAEPDHRLAPGAAVQRGADRPVRRGTPGSTGGILARAGGLGRGRRARRHPPFPLGPPAGMTPAGGDLSRPGRGQRPGRCQLATGSVLGSRA